MQAYQVATTRLFDAILLPLQSFHPLVSLGGISLLTGIVMLIAFRYTSNQSEIRRNKEKAKAHILEIRLFKHDPRIVMGAQRRILGYSLVHLKYSLVPFFVMLPLLVIILVQLHLRFSYNPLRPGESAVVTVKLAEQIPWQGATVDLSVPDGVEIETPALRLEEEREVSWRVKAHQVGEFDLTFRLPGRDVEKRLIVADELVKVSPRKARSTFLDLLLFPGEAPLPHDLPIQFIDVQYPPQDFPFLGWNLHWLVIFCVLSLAGGYALKGIFGVEL
jgi:hypothetical protein